jgi:hypothetical protein
MLSGAAEKPFTVRNRPETRPEPNACLATHGEVWRLVILLLVLLEPHSRKRRDIVGWNMNIHIAYSQSVIWVALETRD